MEPNNIPPKLEVAQSHYGASDPNKGERESASASGRSTAPSSEDSAAETGAAKENGVPAALKTEADQGDEEGGTLVAPAVASSDLEGLDAPPPPKKKKKKSKKKATGKTSKKKGKEDTSLAKAKASAKKDQPPKLGSSRGIETMFRSNYRVHMDLSAIADTKANIMISINGLILPILLGAISPKIDSNPWLLIPTTILMIGCLISMIFAIRSARPRVSKDPVTLDQIKEKGYNILFFGHFSNMTKDDYEEGMTRLMESNEDIYRNMIRDLHGLGTVLNAKYALLRTSYTVFMISITVGVLMFIGTFFLISTGVISVPSDTLTVPYEVIPSP